MENKANEIINQWDKTAESYSQEQATSANNLTNINIILDLLQNIEGKVVLDAGCGDGYLTNLLSSKCKKIKGFDGSKEMVKVAKEKYKNIEFSCCDITKTLPYKDHEFDLVICSLVLMDVPSIDTFLKECKRILKKNGFLVFSIVHPCFFTAEWEKDEKGHKLYKKIENYWDERSFLLELWSVTTHFHRPLTWYSKQLKQNGFAITEIKENPDDINNCIKIHQRRVPLFICLECKSI